MAAAGADERVQRGNGGIEGDEGERDHDQRIEQHVRQPPLLEVGGGQEHEHGQDQEVDRRRPQGQ